MKEHLNDDVRKLALKRGLLADDEMHFALEQIQGYQRSRHKLPSWAETEGIVFPPSLSLEQCSSESTGEYKRQLVSRILRDEDSSNTMMVDLTGGFGVDFSFLAPLFRKAIYVERQDVLVERAVHNMGVLGIAHAECLCADSEEYLGTMSSATLIFADPARRSDTGARTYAISDCTPDVCKLRDQLLSCSKWLLLKLSPMLDWHKAVAEMGEENVREVHIVSVDGECKELLLLLSKEAENDVRVVCADLPGSTFTFMASDNAMDSSFAPAMFFANAEVIEGFQYLLEPNASVMKSGAFNILSSRFNLTAASVNSHLFFSHKPLEAFPGRQFTIEKSFSMNKKEMKQALKDISKANVAVRNFPLSAVELRKRLKLNDGGDNFIFATTLSDNTHQLFLCRKGE